MLFDDLADRAVMMLKALGAAVLRAVSPRTCALDYFGAARYRKASTSSPHTHLVWLPNLERGLLQVNLRLGKDPTPKTHDGAF